MDLKGFSIEEKSYPFDLEIIVMDQKKWAEYLEILTFEYKIRKIW